MCDIHAEVDGDGWEKLENFLGWESTDAPHHVGGDKAREILEFLGKIIKDQNSISYNAGGSALNATRVAAWLGCRTAMYGCVGADPFAEVIRESLNLSSVDNRLMIDTERDSATGTFCTVRCSYPGDDSGVSRKLVIASPASARRVRELDLDSIDLNGAHVLHAEGLLADAPQFLGGLIQRCQNSGTLVSIDLVSAEFARRHRAALMQAIDRGIDFIFCTRREFEALGCEPRSMSERITWIIKADREGVDCRSGGLWHHIDAPQCAVVDEIGAGDAFAGAFLAASIAHKNVPRCLEIASSAAACALSAVGPSPERACVEALRREFLAD